MVLPEERSAGSPTTCRLSFDTEAVDLTSCAPSFPTPMSKKDLWVRSPRRKLIKYVQNARAFENRTGELFEDAEGCSGRVER